MRHSKSVGLQSRRGPPPARFGAQRMTEDISTGDNGQENDEEAMRAWESAIKEDSTKSSLEQGDIDALFGGDGEEKREYRSVIERIIKESMANYDRLPMLDIVFDRLLMMTTASLKRITTANSDINIESISSMRFGDAMNNIPLPGLLAIVNAEPWGGQFVIAIDAPLLYASIEMMLGGRKSTPAKAEGRSFTSIERRLAEKLMSTILKDFEAAFEPLCQVTFTIERVEANIQFAAVAQANSPAVHATFETKLDDRPGRIEFVLPYGTIDPIREILQKVFLGEKLGGDPAWQSHLREEVRAASVVLESSLTSFEANLGKVIDWRRGETIELHIPADQRASITCGKIPMFSARMGQRNGNLALKIEADLGGKEEMVNAVSRR